jgi:hypothetical protein
MPPKKLLQKINHLKKNITTSIEIWIAKNPNQNTTSDLLVSTQIFFCTHTSWRLVNVMLKLHLLLECRALSWKLEHPSLKNPIPTKSCLCIIVLYHSTILFPNPSVGYGICEKGERFGCLVCWMNNVKSRSNNFLDFHIWSKKIWIFKNIYSIHSYMYIHACFFLVMCAQRVL